MVISTLGKLVSKEADSFREPIYLVSGQEAQSERRLGRLSGAPGRIASRIDLSQREACMVQKDPTRGGQLNAASTANHQLSADLVLEVPHLTTERRLRGVQSPLGRHGQTSLLGDGNEKAEMS
jgi:hypothetical protein